MKWFFILIISCFIISCSKTNTQLSVTKEDLSGKWLLKQYAGGIGYYVYTPTDSSILTFDATGNYTSTENDTVTDKGNFEITSAPGEGTTIEVSTLLQ